MKVIGIDLGLKLLVYVVFSADTCTVVQWGKHSLPTRAPPQSVASLLRSLNLMPDPPLNVVVEKVELPVLAMPWAPGWG